MIDPKKIVKIMADYKLTQLYTAVVVTIILLMLINGKGT